MFSIKNQGIVKNRNRPILYKMKDYENSRFLLVPILCQILEFPEMPYRYKFFSGDFFFFFGKNSS
jgi:hypothetical protein